MNVFSDISLWLVVPLLIASVLLSIFYYRKQNKQLETSGRVKVVLVALRSAILFLLGLLLFGIFFEYTVSRKEKPVFITLIDNSSSLKNYADSARVLSQIESFQQLLTAKYGNQFELKTYRMDEGVNEGKIDLRGKVSDLNSGFDFIFNRFYSRNIGGICLISDGNYNQGPNPLYTAEKISLTPVFTLGVGDTVIKKDHYINSVSFNSVAFFGNKFPVAVDVRADKLKGRNVKLTLYQGEKAIASETLSYTESQNSIVSTTFLVDATQIGFIPYRVVLEHLNDEATTINNQQSFFVEVIDSRSRVLLLAAAPHPDVSAIRQSLEKNDRLSVSSVLATEWDRDLKDLDLVVIHGFSNLKNSEHADFLSAKGIPILYIIDNKTTANQASRLGIGLSLPEGNRFDEVQAYQRSNFELFEISESLGELLEKAPPIQVRFGATSHKSGHVFLSQRIGSILKNDAILSFGNTATYRYGVFIGEGLWKWKLFEYNRSKSFEGFDELIHKTTQYLLVRESKDQLRVNVPSRKRETEDVVISAEFYNRSLERITKPDISFELRNEEDKKFVYEFSKGEESYSLFLGKLNAGRYRWKASTEFDGKRHEKKGEFVIDQLDLEQRTLQSDFNLLEQISERTGGEFYQLAQGTELVAQLANREDIATLSYNESVFNELIDLITLLILLVILLSGEWFLRRYYGSY